MKVTEDHIRQMLGRGYPLHIDEMCGELGVDRANLVPPLMNLVRAGGVAEQRPPSGPPDSTWALVE